MVSRTTVAVKKSMLPELREVRRQIQVDYNMDLTDGEAILMMVRERRIFRKSMPANLQRAVDEVKKELFKEVKPT
ncbi:MAG: hypothetical protein ACE5KU_01645 [Nitrososphaerales archaeon]